MKRLSVHGAFALAAVAAATVATALGLRWHQARDLNDAILAAARPPVMAAATPAAAVAPAASAAMTAPVASALATASGASTSAAATADAAAARDAPREVRLAHATALSNAGAFDAAFRVFSSLIEPGRSDAVTRQAQYNLGNMYLRQGLAAASPNDTVPLVELAKQRYRDLLRADPLDWDARYNLERALRAAPEEEEAKLAETNTPVERRNVALRGMNPGDLP